MFTCACVCDWSLAGVCVIGVYAHDPASGVCVRLMCVCVCVCL